MAIFGSFLGKKRCFAELKWAIFGQNWPKMGSKTPGGGERLPGGGGFLGGGSFAELKSGWTDVKLGISKNSPKWGYFGLSPGKNGSTPGWWWPVFPPPARPHKRTALVQSDIDRFLADFGSILS